MSARRSVVAKALSRARLKRANSKPRKGDDPADDVDDLDKHSKVYDCEVSRDAGGGFGMGVEMRQFRGEHLGSLSLSGYAHLVVSIERKGPAHRRGLKLLDRIIEIDEQQLHDGQIASLVKGKQTVLLTIERYEGDALLNLAWHMAVASCAYNDIDMLEHCCSVLADGGMDARKLRVRRDDAREFKSTEQMDLLPGSLLIDVAMVNGNSEIVSYLGDEGEEGMTLLSLSKASM